MNPYEWLRSPWLYNLKGVVLSLGRRSVCGYLAEALGATADSMVLDVGCGTGRHAEAVAGRVAGVDANPAYIAYANRVHRGVFFVGDATRLGLADGVFDVVFCVGLCHHLSDAQVQDAVGEMRRVTKAGGRTWVIDGVYPQKTNPLGYALFRLDRGAHTRRLEELEALLGPEGLRLVVANIPGSFPYQRAVFVCDK